MHADLLDAHSRHLEDADCLYTDGRLANADQLYGYSAECGLKLLMYKFDPGNYWDSVRDWPSSRVDRVHANGTWDRFEAYRSGYVDGSKYTIAAENPFHNWDVSNRYASKGNFNAAYVDPHKSAAHSVNSLIKKAQIEGLL